ncbi:MAG: serine hydrolase domain-containing protein [Propionicimonas sp.]
MLQDRLDSAVAAGRLKGVTAAVVSPAGVWAGAGGSDGAGKALKPESAMWIASITKTFTAAEVVLLASRGLIDLDAPIADYVAVPFDTGGATVRQLLAMRSGFPEPDGITLAKKDLKRSWTLEELLATIPADAPRRGVLGGPPHYNSGNFNVLSELIDATSGASTAAAFRRDLIDPAGLKRTWVQDAETPQAPLSVGTTVPANKLVDPHGPFLPSRALSSVANGAGNIAAQAADVAQWGYQLYGGHVIDAALVPQLYADLQYDESAGTMYGLGTMALTEEDGTLVVGHAGGGTQYPYSAILLVWTGERPASVAVLTPQPLDAATLAELAYALRI